MNIPSPELNAFLEEYSNIAFPDQTLLRADFFRHQQNPEWKPVFLLQQDTQQQLTAASGATFCKYPRITPLFVHSENQKAAETVHDLMEQLTVLRSRVRREDYEKALVALENLSRSAQPPAPSYLVEQNALVGVVDPAGQIIVPVEYARIETYNFSDPGEASLYLCHRSGHQLNSMDVYDLRGNCIFQEIGSLHPREETLLTPSDSTLTVKKVKSLWVIHQSIDRPFPEDPDFQLILENPRRYTLKDLQGQGFEDRSCWQHCSSAETPARDGLSPLAAVIGKSIGCPAESILDRLPDYRAFRLERTPPSLRLRNITADTPLDRLGLSIRAHHCLVRSGLQTAADLLDLEQEAIARLRRSTPEIIREISALKATLSQLHLTDQ